MHDGEVRARDCATGHLCLVRWAHGRLTELTWLPTPAGAPPEQTASSPPWLAPPLVDLQVNGFAGIDFQQDDLTADALLHAARGLATAGCGGFFLTLITDDFAAMLARLERLRRLRAALPELQAAILGWHCEGPFLSAEPGYRGAHRPELMRDPTPDDLRAIRAVAGDDRLLLTLAPERAGALAAIAQARDLGIVINLGHTNASTDTLRQAVAAGATGFTHLGNGCPPQLDRHDNILWRVLETPGLTVGLIPDRIHVSPALFRLLHRLLPAASIYYSTDAMAAAGALPGPYALGPLTLAVGSDGVVRLPGTAQFAGSGLQPIDGVRRAAAMLGRPWQAVWDAFSVAPARHVGLPSELVPEGPARFCLVETTADNFIREVRFPIGQSPHRS